MCPWRRFHTASLSFHCRRCGAVRRRPATSRTGVGDAGGTACAVSTAYRLGFLRWCDRQQPRLYRSLRCESLLWKSIRTSTYFGARPGGSEVVAAGGRAAIIGGSTGEW